jgi:uncharacterized protein YecE (DUF72 family)
MSLHLYAGASGYSFKEWKGVFYPATLKSDAMLAYYAERLPTVELNNTFYAMPRPVNVERWAASVPARFRFSIKAPGAITHKARLKPDAYGAVDAFYAAVGALGGKRGPALFQLPPTMQKDLPRLRDFLRQLPDDHRAAFEFRHDSWFADEIYAALADAGATLCVSEREDAGAPPLIDTTPWGYVRLRLERYTKPQLKAWWKRLRATPWQSAYVYFMHEPTAPEYAATLLRISQDG